MITKLLLKNTDINGALILSMASSFYKDILREGENYKSNENTGLNYFGEYLERHEDRGVSIIEIMAATCLRKDEELPELQIFDGQYEMFVERVSNERKAGFNFELEVLYAMFLIKTKREDLGKEVLKNILSNMALDNKFLIFTGLVANKYIVLDDESICILNNRLKNTKIKLSVDTIINRFKEGKYYLNFSTEYIYLKQITEVYGFKKSNFKENSNIFQSLKNLKKIGTREGIYTMYSDILDLKEDEFYLMALKIAAETYADGVALGRTNNFLANYLEKSLNANCSWYYHLQDINLRAESKQYYRHVKLKHMDFSNVKEDFYDSLIKAFEPYNRSISYSQIQNICRSDNFIEYMKLKKQPFKSYEKNFSLGVIKSEENFDIKEVYYNMIKDHKDLGAHDICLFCKEKLVTCEYILEKVISKTEKGLAIEYNSRDIISSCVDGKNFDILLKLIGNLVDNKVSIDRYVSTSLGNASRLLERNLDAKELENYNKNELISLLNDFNFMYLSEDYNAFIIRNIKNDAFKEALELEDSDILEIANYLIEQNYISRDNKNILKEIVLSEDDLFLESLEKEVEEYLSNYKYYKGYFDPKESFIDMIINYTNKEIIISYINEVIEKLASSNMDDIKFLGLIKLIIKTNLLEEEEALKLIKNRLYEPVLY